MESDFVRVSGKAEIPIGKMKMVKFLDREILIANVNGTYYAIGNNVLTQMETFRKAFWKATLLPARNTIPSLTLQLARWLRLRKWDSSTLRYMTSHLTQ